MIKGKYKKALKDYEKVISIIPENSSDAEFFAELARNSIRYPNSIKFHKYNVVFRMGEAKVISANGEQQKLVDEIIYAKGIIDGHSQALVNYCSSTGFIPDEYLRLNLETFKKTKENIDKIINEFDNETLLLINLNYEHKVKSYDKIHNLDYEDMKKYMLEKNYNLTKADYCKEFDRNAEFFINFKRERIKNEVPDIYVD